MTDTLRSKASERYAQAREKAGQTLSNSRARASEIIETGRTRARERAANVKEQTSRQLETNPLAAIAGGLAIGALLAALLPRTARENKIVGPVSRNVKSTARTAAKVAGNVAKAELIALGVNSDAARQQVRNLAGKIGKAASSAGNAAAKTVRKDD